MSSVFVMAKLVSGRRRAQTTDVGATPTRPQISSPRPVTARGASPHTNRSWPPTAVHESRAHAKALESRRQNVVTPSTLNESTTSLTRASPLRIQLVNESWDDQGIGIALGSPSMVPPGNPAWADVITTSPPRLNDEKQERNPPSPLKRKPSRWKKIGGLFKSKNPEPPRRVPFYEVRVNDQQLRSVDGSECFSDAHLLRRRPIIPDAHQWPARSQSLPRHRELISVATSTGYSTPTESASLLEGTHQHGHWETWVDEPQNLESGSSAKARNAPLIDVNIPQVEMERYSIMFGSFYDKEFKSTSGLLARRSKNLDRLGHAEIAVSFTFPPYEDLIISLIR